MGYFGDRGRHSTGQITREEWLKELDKVLDWEFEGFHVKESGVLKIPYVFNKEGKEVLQVENETTIKNMLLFSSRIKDLREKNCELTADYCKFVVQGMNVNIEDFLYEGEICRRTDWIIDLSEVSSVQWLINKL